LDFFEKSGVDGLARYLLVELDEMGWDETLTGEANERFQPSIVLPRWTDVVEMKESEASERKKIPAPHRNDRTWESRKDK
jgi:hypothetical protein